MWHDSTPFDVLVYLLVTNVVSVCRSHKKLKNEGSTKIRGSAVQELEGIFSVKT